MKKQVENEKLRLIVFESAKELGDKVDKHLLGIYGLNSEEYTFIVPIKEVFFNDGHTKVEIQETVRGKDLYLLTDIGNYSLEYTMHQMINHTSPNDLMIQLLDGIGACNSHADKINVIMSLLFAGRQHRRKTRENLMCGYMLHLLDLNHHIKSVITFDAHDQGVEHAMFNTEFDNFFPTNTVLENVINDLNIEDLKNIVFISPDNGAAGRRDVYLNSFQSENINREAGSFYKRRDYNRIVNGKNPIINHDYCGNDNLKGRTAIVTDDMISSGGSMFDVIDELKNRGIKKVFVITTFTLFTEGIEKFDEYYKENLLAGVYTTNLSYIPESYKEKEWLHVCDCSKMISNVIYNIHNDLSISSILHDKGEPIKMLEKKFNGGR